MPTARISATTRPGRPRAASSATTTFIRWRSPAPSCAVATAGRPCGRCWCWTRFAAGWPRSSRSRTTRSITSCTGPSLRPPPTEPCWGPRPSRSSRPSGWSWRITFPFARFARASSFPTPRAPRPRSRPKWRSPACTARCGGLSARPISFATPRRSSACSSRRRQPGLSPFDLVLATAGDDFAVQGMHFKLGLYEHQSAGAIQGLIDLLARHPAVLDEPRSTAPPAHHDLRAGLRHHRRSGQTRSAHAAIGRPFDGLYHRHAAAQGLSVAGPQLGRAGAN